MKIVKFDKDGNMQTLSGKQMLTAIINRCGYALLALLILSFFLYVTLPFLNVNVTVFQAITLVTMFAVFREYLLTNNAKNFLITSIGYMIVLWLIYLGVHYAI